MARVIVITSGKGGVGKTTLTANLGAAISRAGYRVVVIDADIGLNNLDVTLNVENRVVYDIVDVIENRCRPRQALIQTECEKLYIMPSAHAYDQSKINGQNIKYVVNALSEAFDYVLLDCPAGIEAGFHRAVAAASEAIVVTTPHISAIRDAGKVLSILDTYEIAPIGLVVNRARGDLMLNMEMPDICDIRELLGREVTGVIPEDDIVSASTSAGRLVPEYSAAADAYGLFAKNVIEGTRLIYDCTARYRGVFGRMRRGLRKIT